MTTPGSKEAALIQLARLRQQTRYPGYNSIGDYENGFYECDYVSPYSKSAHNTDADVMIVLQDWSSDDNLQGKCEVTNRLGYTPSVATNIRLQSYLKKFLGIELKETYTTNLFPYIKMGDMSASIPIGDMRKAARQFTIPMVHIIRPKIVVALGSKTYQALYDSCDEKVVITSASFDIDTTRVFYQPHPAARISNRDKERGWQAMKHIIEAAPEAAI